MPEERQDRYDEKALKHFEKRLLEERRLVLRELGVKAETMGATQEARDGDLSNYRFHMADQGTDTMEQEQTVLMASRSMTATFVNFSLLKASTTPSHNRRRRPVVRTWLRKSIRMMPWSVRSNSSTTRRTVSHMSPRGLGRR